MVIPMTPSNALLEPSFIDAIAAIEQSNLLSKSVKRHWVCSLRQIGKWLDRPLEVIPARWTSIRLPVGQLHHARLDVTAKTVSNHRANVAGGAALVRQGAPRIPRAGCRCRPTGRCCAMPFKIAAAAPVSTV